MKQEITSNTITSKEPCGQIGETIISFTKLKNYHIANGKYHFNLNMMIVEQNTVRYGYIGRVYNLQTLHWIISKTIPDNICWNIARKGYL